MPPDEFRALLNRSSTYTQVLAFLGFANKGNNFLTLKKRIQAEGISTAHFDPYGARRRSNRLPLKELLVQGSPYNRTHLKRRLLAEGLLKNSCAICGLSSEWRGQPLSLILDHINGIPNDHRLNNLRLVCPNCASQLPTHAGKRHKGRVYRPAHQAVCSECGTRINRGSSVCRPCRSRLSRKVLRPSMLELRQDVSHLGFEGTGRKYGVSGTAVKKWLGLIKHRGVA